ncbi:MAG: cyclase family protein [Armatimonadetes bacterium]|nr:cyclase family protein [Armatimonadota bacterium]
MKLTLLSYAVGAGTPVYPGDPVAVVEERCSIDGDGYAAYVLHLSNHCGTHVDGPAHFNPMAPPLSALEPEAFVFAHPLLLDIPKGADELIGPDEIDDQVGNRRPDLLLIRTGFSALRATDPTQYASHCPGLSAAAAQFIVEKASSVRAIAVDTISAGPPAAPEESFAAHRYLCGVGRTDGRFVLIYEDARLDHLAVSPVRVWGLPLMVEGLDSAPVTMIAEI